MRILHLFIVFIIAGMLPANAQRTKSGGTKSGLTCSTLANSNGVGGYELSDHYGLFYNVPVSKKLGFQSEILLSIMGGGSSYSGYSSIFSYVSTPLILKYYTSEEANLQLGGSLGYMLFEASASSMFSEGGTGTYHRYDGGLYFGMGYDAKKVQLYARYYYGALNINPLKNYWTGEGDESVFVDHSEMNRAFQIGIEYKLLKKKKDRKQRFGKYARPQ